MLRANRHSSNSLNNLYSKIDMLEADPLDGNPLNEDTFEIKKDNYNNAICLFFGPRIKRIFNKYSFIYFLNVLFSLMGLLLFIYGLFGKHLLHFIISFIFLAPGLILDNACK